MGQQTAEWEILLILPDPSTSTGLPRPHPPSSSTASTVAPRLSRACTTEARPFRAAMWSGLRRKSKVGTLSRMPGCPAFPARSPCPGHSHLQRTVGGIDKAKVLGFCQDHEGTFLMALRKRNRKWTGERGDISPI